LNKKKIDELECKSGHSHSNATPTPTNKRKAMKKPMYDSEYFK